MKSARSSGHAGHSRARVPARGWRWGLCAALLLTGFAARAFELSELERLSALGEPLEVRLSVSGLSNRGEDFSIGIASEADYHAAQLSRPALLKTARVEVLTLGARAQVRIRSNTRAQEPLASLLLRASDGEAVLQRQYTLLFDPPDGSASGLQPVAVAETAEAMRPSPPRKPATAAAAAPKQRGLKLITTLQLTPQRFTGLVPSPLRLQAQLSPLPLNIEAPTPVAETLPMLPAVAEVFFASPLLTALGIAVLALMAVLAFTRSSRQQPSAAPTPKPRPRPVAAPTARPAPAAPAAAAAAEPQEDPVVPARALFEPGERQQLQLQPADFHSEVARLLRTALRRSPQRLDLRYKLLEVSHAAGEKQAFLENARQYASQCRGTNDPAWPAIVAMGLSLAPDDALFSAEPGAHKPHTARHYDALMARGLAGLLSTLKDNYTRMSAHPVFLKALNDMHRREGGRPTALVHAVRLSQQLGGAQIWLKREDLRATRESQRINAYGQVLLARQLGKKRVVAATRSGAHGEAVALAARALGLPVRIFMPALLMTNAAHPVIRRMKSLGAELRGIPPDPDTEADPRTAALADWMAAPETTFYATGLDAGPPPYPAIVADLQSVIGLETRRQMLPKAPDGVMAAICARAAGPAALGFLHPFLDAEETALHCVDVAHSQEGDEHHHRYWREHAWLRASGRVHYAEVSTAQALSSGHAGAEADALPQDALNTATLAHAIAIARSGTPQQVVVALLTNPQDHHAA